MPTARICISNRELKDAEGVHKPSTRHAAGYISNRELKEAGAQVLLCQGLLVHLN